MTRAALSASIRRVQRSLWHVGFAIACTKQFCANQVGFTTIVVTDLRALYRLCLRDGRASDDRYLKGGSQCAKQPKYRRLVASTHCLDRRHSRRVQRRSSGIIPVPVKRSHPVVSPCRTMGYLGGRATRLMTVVPNAGTLRITAPDGLDLPMATGPHISPEPCDALTKALLVAVGIATTSVATIGSVCHRSYQPIHVLTRTALLQDKAGLFEGPDYSIEPSLTPIHRGG